jgi:PAS domain-containing protein
MVSEENYRFQFLNMNSYNSLYEVVADKEGRPNDFRFIMVNQAYEEYVGKKASELIGKTLTWKCIRQRSGTGLTRW